MPDPISIVGLIASIFTLGEAAVKTSKLLFNFIRDVKDVPVVVSQLHTELDALCAVLTLLGETFKKKFPKEDDSVVTILAPSIDPALKSCRAILKSITGLIKKNIEMNRPTKRQRLKWVAATNSEVQDLMKMLAERKTTLNLAMALANFILNQRMTSQIMEHNNTVYAEVRQVALAFEENCETASHVADEGSECSSVIRRRWIDDIHSGRSSLIFTDEMVTSPQISSVLNLTSRAEHEQPLAKRASTHHPNRTNLLTNQPVICQVGSSSTHPRIKKKSNNYEGKPTASKRRGAVDFTSQSQKQPGEQAPVMDRIPKLPDATESFTKFPDKSSALLPSPSRNLTLAIIEEPGMKISDLTSHTELLPKSYPRGLDDSTRYPARPLLKVHRPIPSLGDGLRARYKRDCNNLSRGKKENAIPVQRISRIKNPANKSNPAKSTGMTGFNFRCYLNLSFKAAFNMNPQRLHFFRIPGLESSQYIRILNSFCASFFFTLGILTLYSLCRSFLMYLTRLCFHDISTISLNFD